MPGLPMINHGPQPATKNVEILPYGQRTPTATIPLPTIEIPPSCTSVPTTSPAPPVVGNDGSVTVAGGTFRILFHIKSGDLNKVQLNMTRPSDRYISVG